MRKKPTTFVSVLLIISIYFLTGCSAFVSTPRIARIQIKGPANHTNEVVFALETTQDNDIELNDRYALELDFQWLWYEREDLDFLKREVNEETFIPLTPWFICKYRF